MSFIIDPCAMNSGLYNTSTPATFRCAWNFSQSPGLVVDVIINVFPLTSFLDENSWTMSSNELTSYLPEGKDGVDTIANIKSH